MPLEERRRQQHGPHRAAVDLAGRVAGRLHGHQHPDPDRHRRATRSPRRRILKQLDVQGIEQGRRVVRLNYAFATDIAAHAGAGARRTGRAPAAAAGARPGAPVATQRGAARRASDGARGRPRRPATVTPAARASIVQDHSRRTHQRPDPRGWPAGDAAHQGPDRPTRRAPAARHRPDPRLLPEVRQRHRDGRRCFGSRSAVAAVSAASAADLLGRGFGGSRRRAAADSGQRGGGGGWRRQQPRQRLRRRLGGGFGWSGGFGGSGFGALAAASAAAPRRSLGGVSAAGSAAAASAGGGGGGVASVTGGRRR